MPLYFIFLLNSVTKANNDLFIFIYYREFLSSYSGREILQMAKVLLTVKAISQPTYSGKFF